MIKRAIGLVLALGVAAPAQAQERTTERDFSWEGRIPNGRWLFVRNLNGGIRVDRASGDRVEVTAEKRWRRGNPEDVRIEVRKGQNGDDVVICALWFDNSECDEDGYRTRRNNDRWNRNNDVHVEFTVRLPEGVKLATSTVNGSLRIEGATSEVEAGTVNGSVVATSSGGPVNATTVNGNIEVRMRELGREALNFETVNGSIEVYVPDGLDADVDLRTVNGGIRSDFPLTVSGRLSTRHVRATIGRGGRRLEFKTVNGNVELRKF